MLNSEQRRIRKLFKRLLGCKRRPFPEHGRGLDAPTEQGVYVIYTPKRLVAHVGRTCRGKSGLHQRLANHLHGRSSFVRLCLQGHGKRLRSGYSFRCLSVYSARDRALLEAYAAGFLCPKHIGLGELKP